MPLSDIRIALDVFISGSDNNTPITISVLQNSGGSERTYTPTLANDMYTQVEFGLDQTAGPAFDPAAGFWFRLNHGAGGFGFDAGNTVQIDNVMISIVPEPASTALFAAGLIGLALFRRRS